MQIKNATPFAYGTIRTYRRPPQPELVLVVRGKFIIQPSGVVTLPEGLPLDVQGQVTGDRFNDDDDDQAGELLHASDLADFKLNAEVLLRGTCHVPNGQAAPECPVRFAVAQWSKILRVVGPRVWVGDRPTEPVAFTKMALGYANAFGGPGYALNPIGKGLGTEELPNVEHPREALTHRNERPRPAGFGPLSPTWPQRKSKMGTTPSDLGGKGASFHNKDFDWKFFQAAPDDQQLTGYLRGDEELTFQNLHPSIQVLTTRLPGTRVRAFVKDTGQRFREVRMNLDTVYVNLDDNAVYLTWRGLDAVEDHDLLDVKSVLFASEAQDTAPLPQAHYKAELEAFERDPKHLDGLLSEDERGQVERAKALASSSRDGGEPPAQALPPELRDRVAKLDPQVQGQLGKSLSALLASGAKQGVDLTAQIGASLDRAQSTGKTQPAGSTSNGALASAAARMKALREQAAASGSPHTQAFDHYDKSAQDPRLKAYGVHLDDAGGLPELVPGCDLSGRDLSNQDLSGKDLTGAKLVGSNLTKANLSKTRLSKADLSRAILSEADVAGADFSDADLTEAIMDQAKAAGANFSGATLTRTILHKADLAGANLTGAKGESTVLNEATLIGATCPRVRFDKPILNDVCLEGANFTHAEVTAGVFARCKAKRVNFSNAILNRTSFIGSDLTESIFVSARGEDTTWVEANIGGADFSLVVMPSAQFNQAKADRARFYGANLKRSRFYRANVDKAELVRANLHEANFTGASIAGTRFIEANLFDARFVMVTGSGADFTKANLKSAYIEPTHLEGPNARG